MVFLLGIAVVLGAFAYSLWSGSDGARYVGVPIGGPFALTDQSGALRHDTDFRGELMLVYFGYSFCPDACPTALTTMSTATDMLGDKAKDVQPIFITIDPARDTVAQMKLYASNFTPRLVALTGTPDQVADAARAYRVYFAKAKGESDADYLMDHSGFVYLMGRDGRYLAHFGPDATAEAMAGTIRKYL